jgi:hypothetical protein
LGAGFFLTQENSLKLQDAALMGDFVTVWGPAFFWGGEESRVLFPVDFDNVQH